MGTNLYTLCDEQPAPRVFWLPDNESGWYILQFYNLVSGELLGQLSGGDPNKSRLKAFDLITKQVYTPIQGYNPF
jgi:hypothetical protein